jgi:hypothetical protein
MLGEAEYKTFDEVCNIQATRTLHRMPPLRYADPKLQWVADLGEREGEWLMEHEKAISK